MNATEYHQKQQRIDFPGPTLRIAQNKEDSDLYRPYERRTSALSKRLRKSFPLQAERPQIGRSQSLNSTKKDTSLQRRSQPITKSPSSKSKNAHPSALPTEVPKNFDKNLTAVKSKPSIPSSSYLTADGRGELLTKMWTRDFAAVESGPSPLYGRRPLWSWKQRQSLKVKKVWDLLDGSTETSAVSLHSSKTIGKRELNQMLAVSSDRKGLLSTPRVKANNGFVSTYGKFMSFKPKIGITSRDTHFRNHTFHNTRCLNSEDMKSMVIVQKAAAQTRPRPLGKTRNFSAPLPTRYQSPTPQVPFPSRAGSPSRIMSANSAINRSPAFPTVIILPQPQMRPNLICSTE
eukprot:m.4056 g.4056  ORF g.4056 m.4056 type:complete len:346 (+) comp10160_c0_seq1:73-1110(+)